MSVSASGKERYTTVIDTPLSSGGSEVTKQIDATEDRLIVGMQIMVENLGQDEETNSEAQVYLGNDPFSRDDNVSDHETLAISHDVTQAADNTNGRGHSTAEPQYLDFSEYPFAWDEHVTLTAEYQENQSNNTQLEVIVHYIEA